MNSKPYTVAFRIPTDSGVQTETILSDSAGGAATRCLQRAANPTHRKVLWVTGAPAEYLDMLKAVESDPETPSNWDSIHALNQAVGEAAAYKWAYQYLQDRLRSVGRHGWAHDCDGEIVDRITAAVEKGAEL